MNYLHEIDLDIKTNYNQEEIIGVLEKLFEIALLQYVDCSEFDAEIKEIHSSVTVPKITHKL